MTEQRYLWSLITEEETILLRAELLHRAASGYEQMGFWREAAECWAEQGDPSRAGELYARGGDLGRAARAWLQAGRYQEALSAYQQWEQQLSQGNTLDRVQVLLGQAACHLLGMRELPSSATSDISETAGRQAYQQARELLVYEEGLLVIVANCWEALGDYGGWLGRYDLVQEGYERALAALASGGEKTPQVRICRAYLVQAQAHTDRLLCQQLEERLALWHGPDYSEKTKGTEEPDNKGSSGNINDLFETFFSGAAGTQRRSGPQRGADLRYESTITFEEAVFGCLKEIELPRWEICSTCRGSGAQPGTAKARCTNCQGVGEIRRVQQSIFGEFVNVTMCERCRGEGSVITTPCEKCRGQGRVRNMRRMVVNIPAGVDDGINVRVTGEGEVSLHGGVPGNLYVVLTVEAHPFFKRQGNDIEYELPISLTQATLGDQVEIPTVDGKSTTLKIPAGTQSDRSFRLKGMGVPVVHSTARGDQIVIIKVISPTT